MRIEIEWVIRLKTNKDAEHIIAIEICEYEELQEYGFENQTLSVVFYDHDKINLKSCISNNESYDWEDTPFDSGTKYSCSLQDIFSKYPNDTQQSTKSTKLTFLQSEAVKKFESTFQFYFHCNARGLQGKVFKVLIYPPNQKRIVYRFQTILSKILRIKHVIGTYQISFHNEEEPYPKIEVGKPYPKIKFEGVSKENQKDPKSFPVVTFLYKNLLNRTSLIAYMLGILGLIIVTILGNFIYSLLKNS